MHQWNHWTLQFVSLGILMSFVKFQKALLISLMCYRFCKSYVIWITFARFIYASFANVSASYSQTNNQYRYFKAAQNISQCFFHSRFCEHLVPFAFLTNSTKDYRIVFLDLKIQRWGFGKTLSFDYQKIERSMLITMARMEKDRFPFLTLIFKLVQLKLFIFLHLRGFEWDSSDPSLINDMSSSSLKWLWWCFRYSFFRQI